MNPSADDGLRYLDFEFSEDAQGLGCRDALATVRPSQWPALQAEVGLVLAWARQLPGATEGPLEDGGDWDWSLQAWLETDPPLALVVDEGHVLGTEALAPDSRISLAFTLSGSPDFCQALATRFGLPD
ncbi:MAG: hypothetical protein JOY84_08350 [Curvibacter sp.]|nr:hypothetical protein [Curvibacter sp.]